MIAATSYPLLDAFWTILEIFLFVAWIWLLFSVYTDIFRSSDLSGTAKAFWVIFVFIFPLIGVFVYLLIRGGEMHERAIRTAHLQRGAAQAFFQQAPSTSTADELHKLADLRDRGVLSEDEFQHEKARLLAGSH